MNYLKFPINQILITWTKPHCIRNGSKAAFNSSRQSKTMKKLVDGKVKIKRKWSMNSEIPKLPSIASISNPTSQGKNAMRRVDVLNKLFMRHITDFMSTEGTWTGYGLEISRVKITTDFRIVNVYWLARGDGSDEKLESMLSKAAGPLRHNLSQLRLMGEVPTIKFVKDRHYAKIAEVETLLRRADFGDDYEPMSASEIVKNELSFNMLRDDDIPEMTHNVLGLNQDEIMNRIKQSMSKAKHAWEKYETKIPDNLARKLVGSEEREATIIRLKQEELDAFLINRQKKKYRIGKQRISTDDDSDYEDDFNRFEEADFIEEESEGDRRR